VPPASLRENATTAAMIDELAEHRQAGRLQLVIVENGVTVPGAAKLSRARGLEVRRVGHDKKLGTFEPLPLAWRVEFAHGGLLRQRPLARSFENTPPSATGWLQVACLAAAIDAIFSPSPPWRRRAQPAAA
jgi:hypothetical protein